jgi:glycosyltransferase involved in cell wall biosynthesis
MSCCVPVVATDVGGNPEVVADGVTGFIVPQNPEAMAEKIEMLIQDESLRKAMGKAGRERVLDKFTLQQASERYLDLYNSLVAGRHV